MSNYKPRLGSGNVPVTIDGEALELVPTYAAMAKISSRGGGLRGAMERILQLDADTIVDVIAVGLGYGANKRPPKDLSERIWRTGFTLATGGIADAAFEYVNVLANGGRPVPKDELGDEEGAIETEGARQDSQDPPTPTMPPQ